VKYRLPTLVLFAAAITAPAQSTYEPHLIARTRYTIHAGDKIEVSYQFTPELDQKVTVQPDGFVTLNTVGDLKISELTLEQATNLIARQASSHLKDPKITLTLTDFHKPYYVVAGEIKRPGRYDMGEPTTALQAVMMAGGMDAAAQSSQVILFRRINERDDEVHVLDLHKVKDRKDLEHDMLLEPGDMILVPKDRIAKIDRIVHAANLGVYFNPLNPL
jgi:polysaccharide export outer membrane protein